MANTDPTSTNPEPAITARSRVSAMMQKAVLWSTLNFVATQIVGTVIFLIIAAQLPVHIFGVVALATIAADFIAMEGCYAAKDAIIQSSRYDRKSLNTAFTSFLLFVTLIAVALAASAPFVARAYDEPLLTTFMIAFGVMLIPTPWIAVMDALMLRDLRYRQVAERNIASTLVGGVAGIAVAFSPWFVWAILVQRLVSQMVQVALLYHYTRWAPGLALPLIAARDFMKRFFALWLVKTLVSTIGRVTALVFGMRYDLATVGLLRASNRIAEAVQGPVIAPLVDLWFPLMAHVRGDVAGEREVYNSIVRTATLVSLPIFAGLATTADDIATILLPQQYAGVGPILQAAAITFLLIPVLWFNNMALNAMGMNRLSLYYTLALVGTSLITLFASNGLSAPDVILIMAIPAAFMGIVGNVIVNKRLQQTNLAHYAGLMPPALAVAIMSAATIALHQGLEDWNPLARLSACATAGAAIYFGWLLAFHRQWFMDCAQLLIKRSAKPA